MPSAPQVSPVTQFTLGNAWWMAKLCELAYRGEETPDEEAILGALQDIDDGFESVRGFSKNSSQGIVVVHQSFLTVAFRGTDEPADWLDNINALAVDHPLGEVHRGFQAALMDVWPAMKGTIRSLRTSREKKALEGVGGQAEIPEALKRAHLPLFITGHSLGGAMASLAAAQMIDADEPFYSVYTFGQPRVGDREFERSYNTVAKNRTFRFQNNNDIVTRVPARIMGYRHVGTYIYIDREGNFSRDPGSWYRFLDSVRGAVEDVGSKGLDMIEDHGIEDYIAAIESRSQHDAIADDRAPYQ